MATKPYVIAVDSSLVIQEMITDALIPQGYEVSVASTGEEALGLIRSTLPDLVILSRLLPDVGGLDVIKRLQRDVWTYQIPVIFVTSPEREEYVNEALVAGATDYLLKPFSSDAVRSTVAAALSGQRDAESTTNGKRRARDAMLVD